MYLLQELEDRSCLYSVLSKAYLNVICAGVSLELLVVSRLRDNVLETDLQIFRLTYEMAETYLKYLTPRFSNLKKKTAVAGFPWLISSLREILIFNNANIFIFPHKR